MQSSVTQDRDKYIGGSDIPAIMGISPFRKRMDLLMFKAGLKDNDFDGNSYTEYGNDMESKIRDYINDDMGFQFVEDKKIEGSFRAHVDGADFDNEWILEVKTTSQLHDDIEDYKVYLVQVLFYMTMYDYPTGLLAVYERPEDMSEDFDKERLHTYTIHYEDWLPLVDEIKQSIADFQKDLTFLKENPLASEEELPSRNSLVEVAKKFRVVGDKEYTILYLLAHKKEIQDAIKDAESAIKDAMEQRGIKNATFEDGTSMTYVPEGRASTSKKFDDKKFALDHPDLYQEYLKEVPKKGRSAYVTIRHKEV